YARRSTTAVAIPRLRARSRPRTPGLSETTTHTSPGTDRASMCASRFSSVVPDPERRNAMRRDEAGEVGTRSSSPNGAQGRPPRPYLPRRGGSSIPAGPAGTAGVGDGSGLPPAAGGVGGGAFPSIPGATAGAPAGTAAGGSAGAGFSPAYVSSAAGASSSSA